MSPNDDDEDEAADFTVETMKNHIDNPSFVRNARSVGVDDGTDAGGIDESNGSNDVGNDDQVLNASNEDLPAVVEQPVNAKSPASPSCLPQWPRKSR